MSDLDHLINILRHMGWREAYPCNPLAREFEIKRGEPWSSVRAGNIFEVHFKDGVAFSMEHICKRHLLALEVQ